MKIVPKKGENIHDVIQRLVDEAFEGHIEDFEIEVLDSVHYVASFDAEEPEKSGSTYYPLTYKTVTMKLNYRTKEMDDVEGVKDVKK